MASRYKFYGMSLDKNIEHITITFFTKLVKRIIVSPLF